MKKLLHKWLSSKYFSFSKRLGLFIYGELYLSCTTDTEEEAGKPYSNVKLTYKLK